MNCLVIYRKLMNYLIILYNLLTTFTLKWSLYWIFDRFHIIKKDYIMTTKKGTKILIRANSSDRNETYSIMTDQEYGFIKNFIKSDQDLIILDVWGNIGLFTLWINEYYNIIYSSIVEPDANNLFNLKKNIRYNHLEEKTDIIPLILYHRNNVDIGFDNTKDHDAKKINLKDWNVLLKSISLVEIFKNRNNYNIIKIDIEWGEYNLLSDENKTIFQSIQNIIIEYHEGVTPLENYFWSENIKYHRKFSSSAWLLFIHF